MFTFLVITTVLGSSWALYPSRSTVTELTPSNFEKKVLNSDEVWIVEFFAPWCGHCQALVPEYQKASAALKGVVKVGAVNADQYQDLGAKYGIRSFPTIKIFGTAKNKPVDYNGARNAQGLVDAALKAVAAKVKDSLEGGSSDNTDVVELTDSNFDRIVLQSEDMWLVEFYAPWCGHCKNLAPHWAKAATELKNRVKLGAIDGTVNKLQSSKYGVERYPTIKYFPPGKKTSHTVEDYDGGRTLNDIVSWALEKVFENLPVPKILQIVNQDTFKQNCEEKPLCVVTFLPHILDCQSKCRSDYLKMLEDLGESYKHKMWGWIWCEAGQQLDLENALDIGGFGYPAMAVINAKKMKYSIFKGAFSIEGINEFLKDLSYGRGDSSPLRTGELPKVQNIEPWDGRDGELPQEDDTDLSDIKLDSKDEL